MCLLREREREKVKERKERLKETTNGKSSQTET
jgi:hypothetical protein